MLRRRGAAEDRDRPRCATRSEAGENVVVLDAGDQFQGSLFYTPYKGEIEAEFMNDIGFDAMAVGNHEFDDGPGRLAKFVDGRGVPDHRRQLRHVRSDDLLGAVKRTPSCSRSAARRSAVVGAHHRGHAPRSPRPGRRDLPTSVTDYLKADVAALEAQGVNKIIVLTHVGNAATWSSPRRCPASTLIVGGHSHTLFSDTAEGAPAPIRPWSRPDGATCRSSGRPIRQVSGDI